MGGAIRTLGLRTQTEIGIGHQAIVLDAQPILAFLRAEEAAARVEQLFERARAGDIRLLISVVNVAEVLVAQERDGGPEASHRTLELLQELPLELLQAELELAARAAYFKVRGGISLGDCFAAALAHREGVPVLTADREFERVADAVEVIWLEP